MACNNRTSHSRRVCRTVSRDHGEFCHPFSASKHQQGLPWPAPKGGVSLQQGVLGRIVKEMKIRCQEFGHWHPVPLLPDKQRRANRHVYNYIFSSASCTSHAIRTYFNPKLCRLLPFSFPTLVSFPRGWFEIVIVDGSAFTLSTICSEI